MPKSTIENEVRPYLNSLIENGASYVWLQNFYRVKIKNEVAKAIDALPVRNIYERIHLVRLFIDNQAVNYPEKHQKLIPIRLLFRHSDNIAADLQNCLSQEILKFRHPPNHFLVQNSEKILETLLSIQILLEMRERFEHAKTVVTPEHHPIINEQQSWLNREIHCRVPVTQRNINTDIPSETDGTQKWDFSKGPLGYDTGPSSVWYFFHGENKLALYLQREILSLIAITLTFRDRVEDIAKRKLSLGEILLYTPMTTLIFFLQLMNLAFSPYRLSRTILAEVNQLIYHFVRNIYESILPLRHCNKPFLYTATLTLEIALYTGLLFNLGLPYFIVPFAWTTPLQASLICSALLVAYNGALLVGGLGKFVYELKLKSEIVKQPPVTPVVPLKKPDISNKAPVYLPTMNNGKGNHQNNHNHKYNKEKYYLKPVTPREPVYVSPVPKFQSSSFKK